MSNASVSDMDNYYEGDKFFYPSLHSTVQDKGKVVTQLITFKDGIKKTIRGIKTETIMQSDFTHFDTMDGRKVMVNNKNVLCIEVFSEK